jgi:superfamily II DNA/RNA helicase
VTFTSLGLSAPLVRALEDLGFRAPTPAQAAAIPAIARGGDVWVSAQTGSGKTAAFALPILDRLDATSGERPGQVRALVLAPTRELALQIAEAIQSFGTHLGPPPKVCVAIGGVSLNPQMMALRGGADIVVATPGRLLDLVDKNALRLSSVEILVVDEADRLFSLGFGDELERVLSLLPPQRQNVLLSATFPAAVQILAERILRDPTRVNLDAGAIPPDGVIVQRAIEVDPEKRTMLLRHLLQTELWPQVLVFVASRYGAEHVTGKLTRAGVAVKPLHGELSQGARAQALSDFKAKRARVLVATDVAARGLDIVQLAAVINYDLPRSPVDYLHRIGRTGRAGEKGVAISFVSASTDAHFRLIERRHHLEIARERIAGFEPVTVAAPTPAAGGGIKGKRKSKKDKLREAAARAKGSEKKE